MNNFDSNEDHNYIEITLKDFNSRAYNVPKIMVIKEQKELTSKLMEMGSNNKFILKVNNNMGKKIDAV